MPWRRYAWRQLARCTACRPAQACHSCISSPAILLQLLPPSAPQAPLWSVLFTRRYGPGMVHPAVTDTAPPPPAGSQVGSDSRESAPGSNGSTTSLRRRGSQPAPSTGSSTGGVPGPDPVSESQLVSYPWERRCLGALDYYAGGHPGLARCRSLPPAGCPAQCVRVWQHAARSYTQTGLLALLLPDLLRIPPCLQLASSFCWCCPAPWPSW